jgi:hypothetical protein
MDMRLTGWTFAGLLCFAWTQRAAAQGPASGPAGSPSSRPAVSPYLDLTRRGDTTFNYYRRVRPEVELRAATAQNRSAIGQLRSDQAQAEASRALPTTGHPTYFQNLSHFYPRGPATRG